MKKLICFLFINSFFILSAGAHCGSCGIGDDSANSDKSPECVGSQGGKEGELSCSPQVSSQDGATEGSSGDSKSGAATESQKK